MMSATDKRAEPQIAQAAIPSTSESGPGARPSSWLQRVALSLAPFRSRHQRAWMRGEFAVLGFLVLAVAIPAHFWALSQRPALEWDEPVYFSVASNLANNDDLAVRQPIGVDEHYLYQPPFYFELLAGWFEVAGESLASARMLGAVASLVGVLLIFLMLRRHPGGRSAVVLLLILTTDGWLLYSSRIAIIENVMFPVAILGLLLYRNALESAGSQRARLVRYILAGAVLGVAAVLKHTGLYVWLVLPINWLLVRRDLKGHMAAMGVAVAIFLAYLGGMWFSYGPEFLNQYRVQFYRAIGHVSSRGSVGLMDLLKAAAGVYATFVGTILAATFSFAILVANLVRAARHRTLEALRGPNSLYLAWTVAAVISFSVLGLRFPQYFMLVLIPLYLYAGSEAIQSIRQHQAERQRRLAGFLVLCGIIVAVNGATFVNRFVLSNDNAILEASSFIASELPHDSVVLADEPIGVLIPQPYMPMDLWALGRYDSRPDFVVTYSSLTEHLPDSPSLQHLLSESQRLLTVTGFKETIMVYEVHQPS